MNGGIIVSRVTLERIGEKLKDARTKSGLTQAQVENLIGVNKSQLSYFETGKREINITLLEKLSVLYGYSLNYFLENSNFKEPDTQIAFRGEELNDKDLEVVAWSKLFLENLCLMNQIKGRK